MECLEIIEIRTVSPGRGSRDEKIIELLREIASDAPAGKVSVFRNGLVDSDFSVHILREPDQNCFEISATGIQIASALREFGMVNHTIWIWLR